MERVDVAIIGAGPAGLAISHPLTALGIEHVILDRGRVAQTWRDRWDSFCLVTPNWSVQLPGFPYDGPDPDGFMPRDEVVAFFERYADAIAAPLREGVDVRTIAQHNGGFRLATSGDDLEARAVVVATGAYQRPHRPDAAKTLPPDLLQIDVEGYRSEDALSVGRILIVGSGQSGCQIADELNAAGRDVVLACGKAPWSPRRIGDRDVVWWAYETGFLDATVESLPAPSARLAANILTTGHGGGRDLHLRTLRKNGVTLTGRLLGSTGQQARFAPDLVESVEWGDERYGQLGDLIRKLVAERGLDSPEIPEPEPFGGEGPEHVDLGDFGAVIFAAGFRPDYTTWLSWPDAFDELGYPVHEDGESTAVPGLFFIGVHFLRKRKSSILLGVGEDAEIVARRVATRLG